MPLYCKPSGQGHAVILLHGLLGLSDNLSLLAQALAAGYRVLQVDLVNHGRSPHAGGVNYRSMAADVLALMDEYAIERAAVIGHSMGGKVAMQLAADYPERIRCLVSVDIAPIAYPQRHNDIFVAMKEVQRLGVNSRREADEIMSDYLDEARVRQFLLKSLQKNAHGQWFWQCGLAEIIDSYPAICRAPQIDAPCHVPALFVRGGASDYILPPAEAVIGQLFAEAEIQTIDNASHWLHVEYPQLFHQLVLDFLEHNHVQD
ncbi:MAG TPA: alpha/beta fold hydrolase [Pseudomonadales bacterium]